MRRFRRPSMSERVPTQPTDRPGASYKPRATHLSRERGASEGLILMMLATLVGFAGLAYDGGMVFNARRDANNMAATAARAGANVIDIDAFYDTGKAQIHPDGTGVAWQAVETAGGVPLEATISGEIDERIFVRVQTEYETAFLKFFGIGTFTIEGEYMALVSRDVG